MVGHVYVVLPVYDRRELTLECLGYLYDQEYDDYSVVVVDDGSTDGTAAAVRSQYGEATLLRSDGGLLWGGATAAGVAHVLERAGPSDYVVTLNDDARVESDYLRRLVAAAEENPDAVVGSTCYNYYDEAEMYYGRIDVDWTRYEFDHRTEFADDRRYRVSDVLPGRGLFVPVAVFREIGSFDYRRFPHYLCDYDFVLRARQAGHRALFARDARVYDRREVGGTLDRDADVVSVRRAYELLTDHTPVNARAQLRFVLRHCPPGARRRALAGMADHVLGYTVRKTRPYSVGRRLAAALRQGVGRR